MPLIQWDQKFSIGIKAVDAQHQQLFSLVNKLHEARVEGTDKDIIDRLFEELVQYTKFHFTAEEQVMKDADYPDFDFHHKTHHEFIDKIDDLKKRHLAGIETLSAEVFLYLVKWLTGHIMGMDQKIAPYIKKTSGTNR